MRRSRGPDSLSRAQADRLRLVRQRLTAWGADAFLLTNPRDIRYLSGFIGDDSWALVRAGRSKITVLSDFRFQEQVRKEAPGVRAVMRKKSLASELGKLVRKYGLRRIALQPDSVTLSQRKTLVKEIGARGLLHVDDGMLRQRAVKHRTEVAAIRAALRIQEGAFRTTLEHLRPGQSEAQVAAFLEYQMRLQGADGPSFHTIVAAGSNASLPHAVPGRRRVRANQVLLIDWGARARGYCSDLTRVVAIGRMPARMREVYRVVLEAQEAAIDAIAPGKPLSDIDEVARGIIRKAGYGPRFGHGLGHGIGLDIHEQPVLSARAKGDLEPGQIVTVEPGIYLPGIGGVRIEDDVLVTARGGQVLSRLPKSLESATI